MGNMKREAGVSLILVTILMVFLFAVAGAMTMTSMTGARTTVESDRDMRAFYLADSGAQIGIAKLRAAGLACSTGTFSENLANGSASVGITKLSSALFQVTSTGAYADHQRTVEVYLLFSGSFSLPGAFSVMFNQGVAIKASAVATSILGTARISGMDHAADGTTIADQSKAVAGLAMNTVPGKKTFGVTLDSGGSVVEGNPPVNGSATNIIPALQTLRDYAKDYADIMLTGSRTLTTADTGSYGTSTDPKLVYARVGDNGTLDLGGNFEGYGTLVIETGDATSAEVLRMQNFAAWHGLLLVYLNGNAEVSGGTLVRMEDDSRIVGGLTLFLNPVSTDIKGLGKFYHGTGNSQILYSSELISTAKGVATALTAEVISYSMAP